MQEYFTETEYGDLKIKSLEILTEIALFAAILSDEIKYNPSQLRVPAGSSNGGQWTDGGGGGITRIPSRKPSFDIPRRPKPLPQSHPLDDGHVDRAYPIEEAIGFAAGGEVLRVGVEAVGIGARGVVGAARETEWSLGAHKTAEKWGNQIAKRGWTPEKVTRAIKEGEEFSAPNLVNPSNSATRYQLGDRFVVRDDVTKEILQISGDGDFVPMKFLPKNKFDIKYYESKILLPRPDMKNNNITKIYIELLDEGTPTMRGTDAVDLGNGTYKVLSTPYYDPEDEIWQFVPGTIVRCERVENDKNSYLFAVEKIG